MKNKRKRLVYILLILAILLIILIVVTNYIKNHRHAEYEVMGKDFTETVNSLSISNFKVLEEFENTSDKKAIELAKKIRDFFTICIPKIKEEIAMESNHNNLYNSINRSLVSKYILIDENNFDKICKKIDSMTSDLSKEYTKCDFAWNSSMDGIIITCFYENGEKIVLEMSDNKKVQVIEDELE